jgi:hypothetical protein
MSHADPRVPLEPRGLARRIVAIAAIWATFALATSADDLSAFEKKLPRTYAGEFRWHGNPRPQKVEIKINLTKRIDARRVETIGCGRYDAAGAITDIGVRMMIDVDNLDIEIWEFSPSGSPSFTTDGSHKGKLADDLQAINAEWTTRSTGEKGKLELRAGGAVTCAGETA